MNRHSVLRRTSQRLSSKMSFCREKSALTYIPNDNGSRRPFHTHLQVLRQSDVVEEELEQEVGLLLLESDDPAGDCSMLGTSLLEVYQRGDDLHCGFTKSAFSPVTGCVRTIGCSEVMGSLRTIPPRARELSACSIPECTALSPCSLLRNSGDRRWYARAVLANSVSPPVVGPSSR